MINLFKNGFALLMVASLLMSCSSKQEELVLKSPEGNLTFTFKGNKPTALDPWNVTMTMKGYEQERSLTMDMYNSDLNAETILIDWKDENSCIVTMKQSDDDNRIMDVYFSEVEVRLQERGKGELNLVNPLLGL